MSAVDILELSGPVARERDASPSARDGVDDVRLLPDGSAVLVA
jgi:hypothetical protein